MILKKVLRVDFTQDLFFGALDTISIHHRLRFFKRLKLFS